MASSKQQKRVQVIARYTIKKNGYVCYLVRSSNGEDTYCTTFDNHGHATGCTCPSRFPCYHATQLEALEATRRERQDVPAQPVATIFTPAVSTQTVISKAEQASATRPHLGYASNIAQIEQARNERRARERREHAALNGNRGFNLGLDWPTRARA